MYHKNGSRLTSRLGQRRRTRRQFIRNCQKTPPPISPTAENGTIIIKVNGLASTPSLNQKLTPAQGTACEVSQKKLDSSFNNMINARRGGNGPLFRPEEKFPFRNFAILRAFARATWGGAGPAPAR